MESGRWNTKIYCIREDKWIPTSQNLEVQTPRASILLPKVNDLINPVIGWWNEELILEKFWPIDAYPILSIP
jgi:hypothetical protein